MQVKNEQKSIHPKSTGKKSKLLHTEQMEQHMNMAEVLPKKQADIL
jgi:hypothetical protein